MNRFLTIIILIFISGCASDFGFQDQTRNVISISEFKFKSGVSGSIPPGLCEIKQLKSEVENYGVVFFSNCNPHTNNKSLVTLSYLNLGQEQNAGLIVEDDFNKSNISFQKDNDLNAMVDEKSQRILRIKENYVFMANYYVPKGKNLPTFRAKAYLNSILLSVRVPTKIPSEKVKFDKSVNPIPRPRKRPTFKDVTNSSLEKVNFHDNIQTTPRPKKRPSVF